MKDDMRWIIIRPGKISQAALQDANVGRQMLRHAMMCKNRYSACAGCKLTRYSAAKKPAGAEDERMLLLDHGTSGLRAKAYSSTISPLMRWRWMICSNTSGVQEWYQMPSGYTTAIGPDTQTRRQSTLLR